MEISSQSEVRRGLDGNYKRKVEKFSGFQAVNDESDMLQQMGRKIRKVCSCVTICNFNV